MRGFLLLLALAAVARADVVDDLLSPDDAVRAKAAAAVRASGPGAVAVARELARRLDEGEPHDRIAAARGLRALEVHAATALPSLMDAASAKDARAADDAAFGLCEDVRVAALDAVGAIGPAAREAVPVLAACLSGWRGRVRFAAAHALWRLGAAAAPAEAALAAALVRGDEASLFAAHALGNFPAEQAKTRVALEKALGSTSSTLRTAAAKALHEMGERAAEAAPALRATLKDPIPGVRGWACYALGVVGGDPERTVAAFRALFEDESPWVRRAVCTATRDLGEAGCALERELLVVANDGHTEVRLAAYETLEKLFPDNDEYAAARKRAHRAHFDRVNDESRHETLARFGNSVERAVRGLTKELRDGGPHQRALAAWALEDLGSDAAAAIPALTEALHDPDSDVRYAALAALEDIGLPPLQELFHLLEDGYDQLRWNTQALLRKRRAEIEALAKSDDPAVRKAAEKALELLR